MKKIDSGNDSKNSMRSCGAPQPVVLQFCNGISFFFSPCNLHAARMSNKN
jgi:hypothetical protein